MSVQKQIILTHEELESRSPDIGGRDIVIGFSEPALRYDLESDAKLGALLNARLLSYFLPAVEIARAQHTSRRPRLVIISGIEAAIKWNAKTDDERIIMTINNNLKKDFLAAAFDHFFPDAFSLVEIRDTSDFLKIPDGVLKNIWSKLEDQHPDKIKEIESCLSRFRADADTGEPLYRYALAHLFGMGDINFDWEPHNPKGYCSIGEHHEAVFNEVRDIGYSMLKQSKDFGFEREVYLFDNMKLVIEDDLKAPPPYNGAHRSTHGKTMLDEVTYESERPLNYYDDRPRLKPSMDYIYKLVGYEQYQDFWNQYRKRYFSLKVRYQEAYCVSD